MEYGVNRCVGAALRSLGEGAIVLQRCTADVVGAGRPQELFLIGIKDEADTPFAQQLTLVIDASSLGQCVAVKLDDAGGYEPRIRTMDFTGDGVDDIFISADTGGSGGYSLYWVYSYANCTLRRLFDNNVFDEAAAYTANYEDGCLVRVTAPDGSSWLISLACRDQEYLSQIYEDDCTLKQPTPADVGPLNQLYPLSQPQQFDMLAVQRITGLYQADGLGYLQTVLHYRDGAFFATAVYVSLTDMCEPT